MELICSKFSEMVKFLSPFVKLLNKIDFNF